MKTPPLSERNLLMQESPIRKLAPLAEEAKKRGVKVHHLNIGQPDIRTPEKMLEAYRNPPAVLAYGPSAGLDSYRQKLALYYRSRGINLDKKDIFVTSGGSEAILFTLMAALSPGDEVIIPEPFYTNYNGFAVMAGVRVVPVETRIENAFDLPSRKELENLCSERTRAILFCNPGNPTGAVFNRDRLEELGQFAGEKGLYLIADEVYREFTYGAKTAISILSLPGLEEHAVVIDSVSKRFSACGARIGNIATRNGALLDLVLKFGQARLCPPTIDQMAAEAALDTPSEYFLEVNREYQIRRDVAYEMLSSIPGVIVSRPEGAFYLIAQLPVEDSDHFARWLLTDFHLRGETTMVAPAAGFYSTPGKGKNQIRLAYVLKVEELKRAIEILHEGLKAYSSTGKGE